MFWLIISYFIRLLEEVAARRAEEDTADDDESDESDESDDDSAESDDDADDDDAEMSFLQRSARPETAAKRKKVLTPIAFSSLPGSQKAEFVHSVSSSLRRST